MRIGLPSCWTRNEVLARPAYAAGTDTHHVQSLLLLANQLCAVGVEVDASVEAPQFLAKQPNKMQD